MAETLGTVSAVITLVEISSKLAQSTWKFYRSVQDAPKLLGAICKKIDLINLELQQAQAFNAQLKHSKSNHKDLCFGELLKACDLALCQCKEALDTVESCTSMQAQITKLRSKFRWAFLGKEKTEVALSCLQDAEASLTVVLQLLNL